MNITNVDSELLGKTRQNMRFAYYTNMILIILYVILSIGCSDTVSDSLNYKKPDILFIYTDDQAIYSIEHIEDVMPSLFEAVINEAEEYTNYICSSPYCAPSRASLLSGKFPHNHKHYNNSKKYSDFYQIFKDKSLGILMQQAGYHTIFAGKYFNPGFPNDVSRTHIPEGWDEFLGMKGGKYLGTPWILKQEGRIINRRSPDDEHRSFIEVKYLEEKIDDFKKLNIDKPLFVYYAPFEPHHPQRGESKNKWFPEEYNAKFKKLRLSDHNNTKLDHSQHRYRLRALNHLDDNLKRLFKKFKEYGIYEGSYILFTSDNGFKLNHYGISDKRSSYEEDINLPFYIKHPNSKNKSHKNDKLIGTIDLLPTFLDLAHFEYSGCNGVSIFSSSDRKYILSEMINEGQFKDENWWALRGRDDKIVKYQSGKIEHYNIKSIPEEQLELDYKSIKDKLLILDYLITCESMCIY